MAKPHRAVSLGYHSSGWRLSLLTSAQRFGSELASSRDKRRSGRTIGRIALLVRPVSDAVDSVAALGPGLVGADLADAIEHVHRDALLGQACEEAADGVRRPAHRVGDLRATGTLV